MTKTLDSNKKKALFRRIPAILAIVCLVVGLIMAAAVYSLPAAVSSKHFKQWVERQATAILHRSFSVDAINWNWPGRITIHNARILDEPDLSEKPFAAVKNIDITLHAEKFLQRRLGVEIVIDGVDFRYKRRQDGVSNLELFLSGIAGPEPKEKEAPIPESGKSIPDLQSLVFALPIELWAGIHLTNLNALSEDDLLEQSLMIQAGELHLDMPGLFSQPIRIQAAASLNREERSFPMRVSLLLENQSNLPRTFPAGKARLEAEAQVPGIDLSIIGNPTGDGVRGDLHIDLGELRKAIESFLPPDLAHTDTSGTIHFRFQASILENESILFDCGLNAAGVGIQGALLSNEAIGPLRMDIEQQGRFHLPTGVLTIAKGEMDLLHHNRIQWSGEIRGVGREQTDIALAAGPAVLDLGEIHAFAGSLIPGRISGLIEKWEKGPLLQIGRATFTAKMPGGFGGLEIGDLDLIIPELAIRTEDGQQLQVNDTLYSVQSLNIVMEDFFPRAAALSTSLKIGEAIVSAEREVWFKNLAIPSLRISCDDIKRSDQALFGITAGITVKQTLAVDSVGIQSLLAVEGVKQSLSMQLNLPPEKIAAMNIMAFALSAPLWRMDHPALPHFKTDVELTFAAEDMRLLTDPEHRLDLTGLSTDITMGNLMHINLTGEARDGGKEAINAVGRIRMNLAGITDLLKEFLPDKTHFDGTGTCLFQIAGRLPQLEEQKPLPLRQRFSIRNNLPFIDAIDIAFGLMNAKAGIVYATNQLLLLGPVSADPLLHYRYDGQSGKGELDGRILIQEISGLPPAAKALNSPAHIRYNGRHDDLKTVSLNQTLSLPSFGIDGTVGLSIYGLNQFLEGETGFTPAMLLKKVGGDFSGTLTLSDLGKLPLPMEDARMNGGFSMNAGARLIPGQSIAGEVALSPDGLDLEMKGKAALKRLQGKVTLNKKYFLQPGHSTAMADQSADLPPLSAIVMETGNAGVLSSGSKGEDNRRFIPGPYGITRNLSFKTARIETTGMPLTIRSFQAQLQLNQGLPEIKPFRLDCLGGTLDGAVAIEPRGRNTVMTVHLAFSGINTARFLDAEKDGNDNEDTEISGQLMAEAPITGDFNMILDQANVNATITHIGSRALERFLYALDPHENDESIVNLRQQVRSGAPIWIRLTVKNGSLSLDGEIRVQGVPLAIRLNLSALQGIASQDHKLTQLDQVAELLRIAAADRIFIDEKEGRLTFTQSKQ